MVLRPYDTHDARFRDRTRAGHLIVRGPEVRNVRLAIRFPAMLLVAVALSSASAQTKIPSPPAGTAADYKRDPRANIAAGRLTAYSMYDSSFQRDRAIWVYTPAGYSATAAQPYDLIVAFDGEEYVDAIPLPLILDTLAARGNAPPFVAVLVADSTGTTRLRDLANSARLAEYLGRQLMPWVRAGWNVTRDPRRTIITGSSAGGLAAANVALARPDLFGNVLAQSGAFWRGNEASNDPPYEWLTTRVATLPKRDVRFFIDMGALETNAVLRGSGPVPVEAGRRFRDALVAKGYRVDYTEVPGAAHAPMFWQARLPVGIVTLSEGWRRTPADSAARH